MRYKISPKTTIEGFAFGEYVHSEGGGKRYFHNPENKTPGRMRGYLLVVFLVIFLISLCIRLIQITVIQGDYYRVLSDSNRIRTTIIRAPRGIIFDRFGEPLVFNTPGFRKVVNGKTELLSREDALALLAKADMSFQIDALRQYPKKETFSHVLGYVGQITSEKLHDPSYSSYQAGDLIGKEGIEQAYEKSLKGVDGKTLLEVDALGKPVRTLGSTDALSGKDLTTTLDARLAAATFKAMADVKKGAAIVSTPQGQILSIVSKPSFDPNLFTMGKSYKTGTSSGYQNVSQVLLDSENQPLLNRAIGGVYPPGSTFKLVTAVAGLENNIIDKNFQVEDTGIVKIGEFSFGNWYYMQYGKTDGSVNVVKAIQRSNDIFFYKLAEKVGVDQLATTARQFGVGQTLGIDVAGEAKGLVPTSSWKEKVLKEQWYLGDTYHYGIGQGYVLTTPLQVNAWTQAIANGGTIYRPRLVERNEDPVIGKIALSNESLRLLRQGMIESCSPGGVAWPLFEFRIKNSELRIDGKNFLEVPQSTVSANMKDYRRVAIACKTGTAQHGGEKDLPHAWITLFAPAYDPQIVVTVLSESSGEGSNIAAPIAKKILEAWFSQGERVKR